jgi:hypothetical protein
MSWSPLTAKVRSAFSDSDSPEGGCWVALASPHDSVRYQGLTVGAGLFTGAGSGPTIQISTPRSVLNAVGLAGAYAFYAPAAAVFLPFVWACVRETRGKTPEQM